MKWGDAGARAARPVVAAAARLGGRAHQPRGVDLVPHAHRRRPLPDRRHVVADRDRRHHDLPAARAPPRSSRARPRSRCRASAPRSSTTRASRSSRGGGYLTLTRPWPSMLRGIYGDPERYQRHLLEPLRGPLLRRRRRQDRRRRLLLAARPGRRRDERVRATASRPPRSSRRSSTTRRWPRPRWCGAKDDDHRPGDRRLRDPAGRRRRRAPSSARSCASTWPRRSAPPPGRRLIIFTDELPKTRSGKIMRRLLRDVAEGRDLGDTTTLADPAVVDEIRKRAEAQAPGGLIGGRAGRPDPRRRARGRRRHRHRVAAGRARGLRGHLPARRAAAVARGC